MKTREMQNATRLPSWLRRSLPAGRSASATHEILGRYDLNTVCESAKCPNRSECYAHDTATFMILGNSCTRSCRFCSVPTGKGEALQADEPARVAQAALEMGLKYVVITSVARDDLQDEGAAHFAETVRAIKKIIENVQVEVLTPDFHARAELIGKILVEGPEVYNHNIETVERLQKKVRVQGEYARSLKVLEIARRLSPEVIAKSGLMLGLGETPAEIAQAARDLRSAGCQILTLGQYLPPGKEYLPVERYVSPEEFAELALELKSLGFLEVFSGPYVRSSYHAGETFLTAAKQSR